MPELPDTSVDMILADLPYGTTQNKWDVIIPLKPLWKQYERIIKDNGAIILTAAEPFTSLLVVSKYKMFKYDLIWEKDRPTGFLNANRMPLRNHENILVFYKSLPVYNPQKTKDHKPSNVSGHAIKQTTNYGAFNHLITGGQTDRFPRSVQKFNVANSMHGIIHATQKPAKLFEYLIRTYTNEGDTVLDNVIGSGTTAVAAFRTGRRWIGIEKDPDIYEMCLRRIQRDTQQLTIWTQNNRMNRTSKGRGGNSAANDSAVAAPLFAGYA